MEKEKTKASIILKLVLIVLILAIIVLGFLIFKSPQESEESKEKINITESEYTESEYYEGILDSLHYYYPMVVDMPEFQDVTTISKEYLLECALLKLYNAQLYENLLLSDFNEQLVELFGKNAEGLLEASDLKNTFPVIVNQDGTYSLEIFGDTHYPQTWYDIKNLEKQGNTFYVELYEFKEVTFDYIIELNPGEYTVESIYDMSNNLIADFTIDHLGGYSDKENNIHFSESNYVSSIVENYKDKLSIRTIEFEYDAEKDLFVMVNNKLQSRKLNTDGIEYEISSIENEYGEALIAEIKATKDGKTITKEFEMSALIDDTGTMVLPTIGSVAFVADSGGEYYGVNIFKLVDDEIIELGTISCGIGLVGKARYSVEIKDENTAVITADRVGEITNEEIKTSSRIEDICVIDILTFGKVVLVVEKGNTFKAYALTQNYLDGETIGIMEIGTLYY